MSDDTECRDGEDLALEIRTQKVDVDEARRKLVTNIEPRKHAGPDDEESPKATQADLLEARWKEELRELNVLRLRAHGVNEGSEDDGQNLLEQVFREEKQDLLERLKKFENRVETVSESYAESIQEGAGGSGSKAERLATEAERLRACYEHWESLYEISRRQFVMNRYLAVIGGYVEERGHESPDTPSETDPNGPAFDEAEAETHRRLTEQPYFGEDEVEQLLLEAVNDLGAIDEEDALLTMSELPDNLSIGRGRNVTVEEFSKMEVEFNSPDDQDDEFDSVFDDIEIEDFEVEDDNFSDEE
jgi:hypothetical protein